MYNVRQVKRLTSSLTATIDLTLFFSNVIFCEIIVDWGAGHETFSTIKAITVVSFQSSLVSLFCKQFFT